MTRYAQRTLIQQGTVANWGKAAPAGIGVVNGYGVATGGTALATPPSGYAGMTFTADGTLTVTTAGLFDVLMFSGGGGGSGNQNFGNRSGGGGGGGGKIQSTIYLAATTYAVTVGAGGAGSAPLTNGVHGFSSQITSVLSIIGGGGGRVDGIPAGRGATGGGGWANTNGATSLYTPSTDYGFNGGNALGDYGGGGGGVGSIGANAVGTTGGAGASGFDIATFTGNASSTKGGGGGGGGATGGTGNGGGANGGGTSATGGTASANTAGGGGGGGAGTATITSGGAGGSGIVYIRYQV